MGKKVYSDKTSARDNTRVVLPIQTTFVPRFKPITENTNESFTENLSESAKNYLDVFDKVGGKDIFKRLSNARVNIANKYFIPYIPEKRIRLTTGRYNTGVISTNILDSIYNASQRTGVPFDIALGLAGRESTIGIGRGLHKNKGVSGTDLYSNWQQTGYVHSQKKTDEYNDIVKKIRNDYKTVTDEEYDKAANYLNYIDNSLNNLKELNENPIDNALKFYQSGKYNPGDKRHTQMVEEDAKIIMSDPAIQRWYKNKINSQMKCGGRRKAQLGLDIREGGIAIPIAPNMYYMDGRSHDDGGIAIGPNNKNGLEVEGGEVIKVGNNDIKVFSSVPLLRGVSPAQLVMGGANPNKVFKAQEDFKDRNRINDDGTTYELGGNRVYTPSKAIQKQLQETGKVTIGGAPTIGGLRTFGYLKGLTKAIKYPTIGTNIIRNIGNRISKRLINKSFSYNPDFNPMATWKYALGRTVNQQVVGQRGSAWVRTAKAIDDAISDEEKEMKAGGIYIKPSKRGTFTAAATKRGMGVQEFANKVLANKEDYSPAMVKKANFARNASRWKKEFGGSMIYTINGNVKNGLMSARPKAQYGKTIKINRDSYETVDEAVERYKQLYRIRYGKEPSKSNVNRVAWMKTLETAIAGDPNLITGYGPNVGVRGPNVTKIVSGANKGRQIARTQTAVRNKNVKSATPQRQAINTKVSQAARNERLSQFDIWQQGEPFQASTMPTDAIAVSRQPISTGVRSGRKGRVDDVVAIKRSQRNAGVDPLASKKPYSNYDDLYAEKFYSTSKLLPYTIVGSVPVGLAAQRFVYGEPSETVEEVTDSINNNKKDSVSKTNNNTKKQKTPVSNNKKNTVNNDTDNAYVSTTTGNTGDSYRINPITGEWIRNNIVETPEPSIKGTTRVISKPSSTPRGRVTNTSKATASTKPTTVETKQPKLVERPKENLYITGIKNNAVKSPLMTEMEKISAKPASSSTGGGTQANADERLIPQFKSTTAGDWIDFGANLAGHMISYFANRNLLDKYPMAAKPAVYQADKLKTKYNIEPQLSNIRESEQVNRATVARNTQSSNTSVARQQRLLNEARNASNVLYGQKENIETQLINQDKLNRQSVYQRNVDVYNDWLNRTFVANTNKLIARQQNMMNLINGIPLAVNNIIGTVDSRRTTNNTLRAIAAANPNVDGRLLGIGDYYLGATTKRKYDKFGKLIR